MMLMTLVALVMLKSVDGGSVLGHNITPHNVCVCLCEGGGVGRDY